MNEEPVDIRLVSMPWAVLTEPSLGLALLKSCLARSGHSARVHEFHLWMLEHLKASTYAALADLWGINDFLFSGVFEPELSSTQEEELRRYADGISRSRGPGFLGASDGKALAELFRRVRREIVPRFLQRCIDRLGDVEPSMVGFTCMYDQTLPSLALARLLKARWPSALIVLGGYAVRGATGATIMRSFSCVDVVVLGEAEDRVAAVADAALGRAPLGEIPGILYRGPSGALVRTGTAARPSLNDNPSPNFGDYMRELSELDAEARVAVSVTALPLESSRGCWWGQKHHCTFCGIDDESIRYSHKDPEVVIREIQELRARHDQRRIRFVDYILPLRFYKDLLPALAEFEPRCQLSCEIKSNARPEHFRVLRDAGFIEVQPGVESFSTPALRRMRKGVTAIQNVQTLKLGAMMGIKIRYNILLGFPDDEARDYYAMMELIPALRHLDPPHSTMLVWVTRYSPLANSYLNAGFSLRHEGRYGLIFSPAFLAETGFRLDDYCYYFERPYVLPDDIVSLTHMLRMQTRHWAREHDVRRPTLEYGITRDGIEFFDSRFRDDGETLRLSREHGDVYAAIGDGIVSVDTVTRTYAGAAPVEVYLDEFVERRLIMRDGKKLLALALPRTDATSSASI